jgi:MFS transporter, NNP family, nitrate/nitrite transporter
MTAAVETVPESAPGRGGRWIDDWRPEDPDFWAATGARVARRNLVFSIFSEHIGFSVWTMWSVMVLFLGPAYHVDPAGKFLLTAVPALVGSVLRLPYTLAVAVFGGRNWTIISAALLLLPTIPAAVLVKPGVSYTTLMILAAITGVGGGNFASSMTNINAFYPQRYKGWALGLNAGGGNIGVAAIQLVGLAVLATAGAAHPELVPVVYLPLIVIAALCAALFMDNLSSARNDRRAVRDAARDAHTWVMSLLYIGTFGSFIGFGFAFGQVLQVQFKPEFKTAIDAAYLTFLGPLLGSLIRPVGGWLADRLGGALVTFWNFVAMAASAGVVLVASQRHSLALFLVGFIALFVFSGVGNGSTYKMIPAIFRAKLPGDEGRRLAGALIGIAGAVGAFGGVLVNVAFRQSFLAYKTGTGAYIAFIAFYALCVLVTWVVYLRPSPRRLPGV